MNELSVLDVSTCESLMTLECSDNQLTSIDISGCNLLTAVNCENNLLTSLDISNTPKLTKLSCKNNNFTFLTLPLFKPPLTTYSYAPQQHIALTCPYDNVDLSSYYNINNSISNFIWRNRYTVITPKESKEGRFTFDESYIGDSLICWIQNSVLPLLVMHFDIAFTKDGDPGNLNPKIDKPKVYAGEQAIHVISEASAVIAMYSLQGSLLMKRTVNAGHTRVPVERGIYVVVVNDTTSYKLIVN